MNNYQSPVDLAGEVCFRPNFWQTKNRINYLIAEYLSIEKLCDRLEDLPQQFNQPQPRQWQLIDWQDINSEQIIGIDLDIFLAIIKGALDTEAPIRGYTQTSRQYLAPIHPSMAKLVGGIATPDGKMLELGLWEKEERQHTPALIKIYQQLTKDKVIPKSRTVKNHQATDSPYQDLYRHGLHRVATEYSATCLYLWLMAHTTGTIQQVLGELLTDEVNHMTKFWGMGLWLYPDAYQRLTLHTCREIYSWLQPTSQPDLKSHSSLIYTFRRMMPVLKWQTWTFSDKMELICTFIWVLGRMWHWTGRLTPEYLQLCCASPQFFKQ